MEVHVEPPSLVRQGKWVVPAYRMSLSSGSKAKETTGLRSVLSAGEFRVQLTPASALLYTPSDVPAAISSGFAGNSASDQTAFPFIPGRSFQELPASVVLYT